MKEIRLHIPNPIDTVRIYEWPLYLSSICILLRLPIVRPDNVLNVDMIVYVVCDWTKWDGR